MATSGSIDYSVNARELCTFALQLIRVVPIGETASSEDMDRAKTALNMMMKTMQLQAPSLWRQTFGNVTLVTSTASYTLTPKPFRVIEARYRDTSGRDLPMEEMTRQEYVDLPLKTTTGVPTSYYVDVQRAATTLYVWPVPSSATTETVQYTYQRVFEDIDSLDNDLDVPQEHLETLGYQLAARLHATYGKSIPEVLAMAKYLMDMASDADREPFVRFIPGRR